jgi:DnaJ-class molecular chaperone
MNSKDYYKILNISDKADENEIKKSFRKLSLQYHPDRGGDGEKFKEINEAYSTLSDKNKRRAYDMQKNNPFMNNMDGGGVNFGNDLFNMFFSEMQSNSMDEMFKSNFGPNIRIFRNGVPVNQVRKPDPIQKIVEITLEQCYTGCNIPIVVDRWIMIDNTRSSEKETIYVDIPKGIDNNEIIVLESKGNIINENLKGSVKIIIKINNHNNYIRKGLDLHIKKKISLKESLCGFSFNLDHINNHNYTINNSSGNIIYPNYIRKINDMGMIRNDKKGNLYIEFIIEFPKNLSEDKLKKIKELL